MIMVQQGNGGRRMTGLGIKSVAAVLALAALSATDVAWAGTPPSPAAAIGTATMVVAQQNSPSDPAAAGGDQGGLSDATKQGIGCLVVGGGALTYATFVAGATETLMIAAGGLLSPSTTPTLWLGLTATLVAGTCSLGAAATPAVLWALEQKDNIGANLSYQARALGHEVMVASSAVASSLFAATPAAEPARQLAERPEAAH
jgi:hypothetical protein